MTPEYVIFNKRILLKELWVRKFESDVIFTCALVQYIENIAFLCEAKCGSARRMFVGLFVSAGGRDNPILASHQLGQNKMYLPVIMQRWEAKWIWIRYFMSIRKWPCFLIFQDL